MVCVEETGLEGAGESFLDREVTQEDWDRLEYDLQWQGNEDHFDLSVFLQERGFSSVVRGIKLAQENFCYYRFTNAHFIDCDFQNSNFSKGTLENVTFSNCNFEGAIFFGVNVNSLTFNSCRLSYTCWNQAKIHDFRINGLAGMSIFSLKEDLLEGMTFLGAQISGYAHIENCSLKNIVFSGNQEHFSFENCTPHEINRPIIGIGMNLLHPAVFAKIEVTAIRQFGGIPFYYMHYPDYIDASGLRDAVCKTLIDYDSDQAAMAMSRGQWILENPRREHIIEQVKNYTERFFSAVDGLVIPGREHVPSLLYKEFTIDRAYFADEDQLLRSIIEFTLLDLSEKNNKPAIGICRGCQMMNIFLNRTLENCPDKTGPLQLDHSIYGSTLDFQECAPCKSFLDKIINEDELYALSLHGQAVEKLGETVRPLLWLDDVMKFSLAKGGLFVMSQVHPEIIVDDKTGCIISANKEYLIKLRESVNSLSGEYDDFAKEIVNTFLQYVNDYDMDDILYFFGFTLDGKDDFEKRVFTRGCYFWSEEEAFQHILMNKQNISEEIDCHIDKYLLAERQFELMMHFSKHVFDLFFDLVSLCLCQKEQQSCLDLRFCS